MLPMLTCEKQFSYNAGGVSDISWSGNKKEWCVTGMSDPCPICGDTSSRRIWGNDKKFLFTCPACGSDFTLPRPSLKEQLEAAEETAAKRLPREQDEEVIATIAKHNDEILDFLARQNCSGYLLDVGCGRGILLADARSRGWNVKGVEPVRCIAEEGRRKRLLDICVGVLEKASLKDSSFDAIIFCHSLEHLVNPLETLQLAYRLLKERGWIYIETPNWASLARRILGRRWWHVDLENHLCYFSPTSLKMICHRAGLRFRFGYGLNFDIMALLIRLANLRNDDYDEFSTINGCLKLLVNRRGAWRLSRCLNYLGRVALRRSYLNDYLAFWFQK